MSSTAPEEWTALQRARWALRWRVLGRSLRLRRWMWAHRSRSSPFVRRYLAGLKGIEIGASAHNDYGVDAINVDRYADMNTVYKSQEWDLCGRQRHVDLVARGDDLPFTDGAVDFVLASHVIEHFPDPVRALEEWLRVAQKYVVIVAPHRDRTFDRDEDITSIEELVRRHEAPALAYDDQHWSVWTCESFVEMCNHFGLAVVACQDPDDQVGNGFTVILEACSPAPEASGTESAPAAVSP